MSKRPILAAAAAALLFAANPVGAVELITNGDFETGTLAGWSVASLPGEGIFIAHPSGTPGPLGGFATSTSGGSGSFGSFIALSDQTGPGTQGILQSFTLPALTSAATLTFDMFVNDLDSGPIIDPIGLDHTGDPNQHARVDILTSTAGGLSTAPADVVANFYLSVDGGPVPNDFTGYTFDLLAAGLVAGGTYQLRFAETDNQGFLNQGVDNVSVKADVVPEPTSLAACVSLFAVGAIGYSRRRKNRK